MCNFWKINHWSMRSLPPSDQSILFSKHGYEGIKSFDQLRLPRPPFSYCHISSTVLCCCLHKKQKQTFLQAKKKGNIIQAIASLHDDNYQWNSKRKRRRKSTSLHGQAGQKDLCWQQVVPVPASRMVWWWINRRGVCQARSKCIKMTHRVALHNV